MSMIIESRLGNQISWSARYGERHRLERISEFPPGVTPPCKVRIYRRRDHYVLQTWDPATKRNVSDRVDGDLVAAIVRAREIEERLMQFKNPGLGRRGLKHGELASLFEADLARRVEASEIAPRTCQRYRSALAHFANFVRQPEIQAAFPNAASVNREFAQRFAAWLSVVEVSPNGHESTPKRPIAAPEFIVDVTRMMFAWAADPLRGNLLPVGFRNPFADQRRKTTTSAKDLFGPPRVTSVMATDLFEACDEFQLPLFGLLSLYGLRATEPCYAFRDQIENGWLQLGCQPALEYWTKGRRSKRLPLLDLFGRLWRPSLQSKAEGLLFLKRSVVEGRERAPLIDASLQELEDEFRMRCRGRANSAAERELLRNRLLRDAGGLTYDQIELEFQHLVKQLGWPKGSASLKDLRHLFATAMQNAGMPEFYRQYLLGHAPSRAASAHYTHLDQLRAKYVAAVQNQLQGLVEVIVARAIELGVLPAGYGPAVSSSPLEEVP